MIADSDLAARLTLVGSTLGAASPTTAGVDAATSALLSHLGDVDRAACYLLLSVVIGRIPEPAEVVSLARRWTLDGADAALAEVVTRSRRAHRLRRPDTIRVVDGLVVDVTDTAATLFTSGIQRVVRSTLPLLASLQPTLLSWTAGLDALRTLSAVEAQRAMGTAGEQAATQLVVPFRAHFVLPEIAVAAPRAARIQTIALYSGSRTSAIGYDCIPVTTAETAGGGMPGGFAKYLAALSAFDAIAPISSASADEFLGWKQLIGGAGLSGPVVQAVDLPGLPSAAVDGISQSALRSQLAIGDDERVVAVIGSHEPRKNHLAVLQASQLLWEAGLEFVLVMVGGNSWDAAAFERTVSEARAAGHRIITLTAADDALVWALYKAAEFTVFPSLNEGYGLPIVESLASRTPVITSGFGSMRELAEGYGGVLVDPRNDDAIRAAMERLLTDPVELARLEAEAARLPERRWADYASDLRSFFELEGAP